MPREFDRRRDHQPDWTPPVGRLFIRTLSDVGRMEATLCYADKEHHFVSILEMREWTTDPREGTWYEYDTGTYYHTGAGGLITRRMATDLDIVGLVRLWPARRSRVTKTPAAWAEDIACGWYHAALAADEKARLVRVVALALDPQTEW